MIQNPFPLLSALSVSNFTEKNPSRGPKISAGQREVWRGGDGSAGNAWLGRLSTWWLSVAQVLGWFSTEIHVPTFKWLKIMGYHGVHLRTSSPAVTFSFGGHPKLHHPSNFDETGFRGLGETIFNRNHNHKSCSFQLNSRCGGAAVTLYCTSIPLYLRIFSFFNPYFLFETNSQKFLRWQDSNPVFCLIFLEGGSGSTDHLPGRLPSLGRLGCDRWWDATW